MKRVIDIIFACAGLIILSPVFAIITILLKLSGSKIIFSQERVGKNGRPFRIYKFETMRPNADITGPLVSKRNDPRSTKIGNISTCIVRIKLPV